MRSMKRDPLSCAPSELDKFTGHVGLLMEKIGLCLAMFGLPFEYSGPGPAITSGKKMLALTAPLAMSDLSPLCAGRRRQIRFSVMRRRASEINESRN